MRLRAYCIAFTVTAAACGGSSDDTGKGSPDSGGAGGDSGSQTPVNGCTDADFAANDWTLDESPRVIQGSKNAAPIQYAPHCVRVRAGQQVTFDADTSEHPIDFEVAPGSPEPFPTTKSTVSSDAGVTVGQAIVLQAPGGIVGFTCQVHPDVELGAIQSVE